MQKKAKGTLSIRQEMFLLGFTFLVVVSMLFAGVFLKTLYHNKIGDAKNLLQERNSQIVTFTEGLFRENASIVEILSRDITVMSAGNGNRETVLDIFEPIKKFSPDITYIYSGYTNGQIYISEYTTPIGYDATTRPWYQAAMATDGVARLVYRDAVTDEWLFSQCMKITNPAGEVVGAVCIDCSNESIVRQLSTKYQYSSQRSYIVDSTGTVLIHPIEKEVNTTLQGHIDSAVWEKIVDGQSNYTEYLNGTEHSMAYFERIPQTEFIVVTAIDASEVIHPIVRNVVFFFILIVVMSIIAGFLLSRILILRFAWPVIALEKRIQSLAQGHVNEVREVHSSNAEINNIAKNIEIIVKDIANREEKFRTAEYLSFHDSMTGLYNRRFFEEELRRLDVSRNYPLSVICCDVNGLKLVNDVFGHAVGDQLIKAIAIHLGNGCRADDILARIGGDEFALILPQTTQSDAQKVVMRIEEEFPDNDVCGATLSASMGYATKTGVEQALENVLRSADQMMYEHKVRESAEMKRKTISNIITAAENAGLVAPLSIKEAQLLDYFSDLLCPEQRTLLKESYRLRQVGKCSHLIVFDSDSDTTYRTHAEVGYRVLSALDECRGIAGHILHYMEHWDGSGWPGKLSGKDIPLLSRILAVADAYCETGDLSLILEKSGVWYDPELVEFLRCFLTATK